MSKKVKYNYSQILLEFNLNNNIRSKNICFFVNIVIENQILKKNVGLRIYLKPTLS